MLIGQNAMLPERRKTVPVKFLGEQSFSRAEGVRGVEGIVGLLRTGLPADALDALDLLKIADVGLDDIGSDPDGEDAQRCLLYTSPSPRDTR